MLMFEFGGDSSQNNQKLWERAMEKTVVFQKFSV